MEPLYVAIINTIALIVICILFGKLIDNILNIIINILVKRFGVKFTLIFTNYITFIGTVHHELAHALLATLTGAKVTELNLFKPNGNSLGNIKFTNRGNFITKSIQNTMSALAPVMLGCISEYILYIKLIESTNMIFNIFIIYVMISILLHMRMSKQDIKIAIKGLPICSVIICVIFYILKINIFSII